MLLKIFKTEDNFNAEFNNDVKLSEMERIIDVLFNVKRQSSFKASEFMEVYNHFENPQRFSSLFSIKNVKHSINTYLKHTEIYKNVTYKDRYKRWFKG